MRELAWISAGQCAGAVAALLSVRLLTSLLQPDAYGELTLGVTIATQYKRTPEDVGDLWYFLAALADKLSR